MATFLNHHGLGHDWRRERLCRVGRGGLPEPGFRGRLRDAAFEQIAGFWVRQLLCWEGGSAARRAAFGLL